MPKITYIDKKFSAESLRMIEKCNEVIANYAQQGFSLTLRQLYYQMVSRNIIENTERSYKRLGDLVSNARLAGVIDWHAIEDRGRNLRQNSHWNSPASIIESAYRSFRIDKWEGQEYRPEVWVEKQALEGVVGSVCQRLDVPYFACKGYNSQSEQWQAAQRLQGYLDAGQTPVIFHLGDHDPSGIDMTRDNRDRLELFMGGVKVERLALNMDQINQYNPPPNPAKESDSRFVRYTELYGNESWELDALEPQVMVGLIEAAVLSVRDDLRWQERQDEEEFHRNLLQSASRKWEELARILGES